MKKLVIPIITIMLAAGVTLPSIASASPLKGDRETSIKEAHKHHHLLIDEKKLEELTKAGYTKEEIFMGAILGKRSSKDVEDVLSLYKKNGSWEKTAKELGIDMEEFRDINEMHEWGRFIDNNQDEVIEYLAEYANKKPAEISAYIEDGLPLRFLIGAGIMAKLSNKDLEDIINLKREGQSFHTIMRTLSINQEAFKGELVKFKKQVKKRITDKETSE